MVKLNNSDDYESIKVMLTPTETPKVYELRVQDLMTGGMSREDAEEKAKEPYEMELYYEPGVALFAVDSEAVDSGTIYSPYTAELCGTADER